MKQKIQLSLAVLFIASFVKSFKFNSNGYDIVFIILLACIFLAYEFITEQATKKQLEDLRNEVLEKNDKQEKELEAIKNHTSKMALTMGYRK